jgi:hypothetical protein
MYESKQRDFDVVRLAASESDQTKRIAAGGTALAVHRRLTTSSSAQRNRGLANSRLRPPWNPARDSDLKIVDR